MTRITLYIAVLFCTIHASAQQPIGFVYYDADRLYDTLPSLFYNDEDFTPRGRLRWDTERYERKIRHTAAVFDSMRMTLAAVAGIENEEVVRDLVAACSEEYCYIHRTFNGFDGLDIALLYHADRFFPSYTDQGRGWLYVEGTLDDRKIGLLLCRDARYASEALGDCRENHPDVALIAAGRFSIKNSDSKISDALSRAQSAGRGNVRYRNGWRMRDRILTDTALHPWSGDVYLRIHLMDMQRGAPIPTYEKQHYRGGYSPALPVFVYLRP